MRLLTLLAALPATLALALAAGCSIRLGEFRGFGDADVWTEADERCDLAADGIDCVAVTTHNGHVTVAAAPDDRATIELVAHKRTGGDDLEEAQAAMQALVLRREQRGSTLIVQAEWPDWRDTDWQAKVDFTLTVPARMAAKLVSHNGDLRVTGLRGAVDLDSHNGDLVIQGVCGRICADTHNGAIECCADGQPLDLATHNGDIRFTTQATCVSGAIASHNGDIVIGLPADARGTIEGRGRFSHASYRGDASCAIAIDGRDFRVTLEAPSAAKLRVSSHNGRVELR